MAKVGFYTFALLREPAEHVDSLGFVHRVPHVFEMASTSQGFLERWFYDDDVPFGPREVPSFLGPGMHDDSRVQQTLSLWEDLESVFAFAYGGLHAEALQHRREWFVEGDWPTFAIWWSPDDHHPTVRDAMTRFEHLRTHGPTPFAFDFRTAFDADGRPARLDRRHAMTLRQELDPRALELAARFEQAHQQFTSLLDGLSDEQWCTLCPGEERTVAALAHHVAWGYGVESGAFRAMAEGREVEPWTRAALSQVNAEHGEQYAEASRAETMDLLQRNAAAAAAFVRALNAEQLQRSGRYDEDFPAMAVDQWVERVLIGHISVHLRSIRASIADVAPDATTSAEPAR